MSCFATPISRYEELRGMYDGHCSWFRAANKNSLKYYWFRATKSIKDDVVNRLFTNPIPKGKKRLPYYDQMSMFTEELSQLTAERREILSRGREGVLESFECEFQFLCCLIID
ncbi:unnamed protein product [Linum trigynum]|uniref:Uncharacterized protein n=1 Tax=Linum trigynum TaxID=586398 RepID=A0AAV2GE76_9ROSI